MNAIPTSENAEQLHKEEKQSPLTDIFDNVYTYTGQLKFDLSTGEVQEYSEKLDAEWLFIDPFFSKDDDKAPAGIRMGAVRSIEIKKID